MKFITKHYNELCNYSRKVARQNSMREEFKDIVHEVLIELDSKGAYNDKTETEQVKITKKAISINFKSDTSNYIFKNHKYRYYKATRTSEDVSVFDKEDNNTTVINRDFDFENYFSNKSINSTTKQMIKWVADGNEPVDFPEIEGADKRLTLFNKALKQIKRK